MLSDISKLGNNRNPGPIKSQLEHLQELKLKILKALLIDFTYFEWGELGRCKPKVDIPGVP